MLNLLQEQKVIISSAVRGYESQDSDTKAFFVLAHSIYKAHKKSQYGTVTKELTKEIELHSNQDYVVKHFKKVMK